MTIQILGKTQEVDTCSLTGRKVDEAWILSVDSGKPIKIGTKRLLEVLRMLTSVGAHNKPLERSE